MKSNSTQHNYTHSQRGLFTKKHFLIISFLVIIGLIIFQLTENSNEEDFFFQDTSISPSEQLQLHDLNSQLALVKMRQGQTKNHHLYRNESLADSSNQILSNSNNGRGGVLILSNLSDQNTFNLIQESSSNQHWPMIAPLIQNATLEYPISSHFGYRLDPLNHLPSMHHGVDFLAPIGTPVVATADGMIIKAGQSDGYGLSLEIQHANGFKSKYAHASLIQVKIGDEVKQGQVIAFVGNSGRSTGAHLHYEILISNKPIDPIKLMK
jgi:murein DD-endopeptidase MepM/ murein hydrolase activator NlpD